MVGRSGRGEEGLDAWWEGCVVGGGKLEVEREGRRGGDEVRGDKG